LVIITVITLFVLGLMLYIMLRFNAKANPVPSKNTHNTLLEVAWTVIPILILVAIAIPSLRLLYLQRDIPVADMTVKVIGNPSWNWTYEYPDLGLNDDGSAKVTFTSYLKRRMPKGTMSPICWQPTCRYVPSTRRWLIVTSDPEGIIRLDHSLLRHEDRRHSGR
jgi:cytochrome c oxidase subunit 2